MRDRIIKKTARGCLKRRMRGNDTPLPPTTIEWIPDHTSHNNALRSVNGVQHTRTCARAPEGGEIFEITRMVGWAARIPERHGARARFHRAPPIIPQEGEEHSGGTQSATRGGAGTAGKWGTCQLVHLERFSGGDSAGHSGENVHLGAQRAEFEVVCEQASECALAWPSESASPFSFL